MEQTFEWFAQQKLGPGMLNVGSMISYRLGAGIVATYFAKTIFNPSSTVASRDPKGGMLPP